MESILCPTDSRLRPDIRKLEMGDQDGAASEKARLEEKQRDSRKARKHKKGSEYVPRYKHFISEEPVFTIEQNINVSKNRRFGSPVIHIKIKILVINFFSAFNFNIKII